MKLALLVTLIIGTSFLGHGQSIAESHIAANVPDQEHFATFLSRDVAAYLSHTLKEEVSVEFELLRDGPTQTGIAYPKFYAWIRASADGRLISEGAMRLAAIEKKRFEITDYLTKAEIVANPKQIEQIFPQALIEKVMEKAEQDAAANP